VDGVDLEALPFWWMPDKTPSFSVSAPFATKQDAGGRLVWLKMLYDGLAYLGDKHRSAIRAAANRSPSAIIVTIENAANDIFTYNVDQSDPAWPVPVVIVADKHRALLETAEQKGSPVGITVKGRYDRDISGRNAIGRLDRGASQTIVISTPTTGWFDGACERGAGIANFLAMARFAAASKLDVNFLFVATAGHEIGHGGMEIFLERAPPRPQDVLAWIHFGSSNACYGWMKSAAGWVTDKKVEPMQRRIVSSPSLARLATSTLAAVEAHRVVADRAAPGELRDVKAAGYPNFIGIVGRHLFFHTPADTTATTGPEVLETVARAFAGAITHLAERKEPAPK
jgi:hypothetical protein